MTWVQTDEHVPIGARIVIVRAMELYAVVREHADFLPDAVLEEAGRFAASVAEHVEVVE